MKYIYLKKTILNIASFLILFSLFFTNLANPVLATGGYYSTDIIDETRYVDKYFEIDKDGNFKVNIYLGDELIATESNTTTDYYINDHVGSPTIITDQSGDIVELNDYEPYGKVNYNNSQVNNNYKYTGKEQDGETDLQYYGARYLDNNTARFYSVDPMLLMFNNEYKLKEASGGNLYSLLSSPQRLNSYSYAINNPLKYNDPTGYDAKVTINGRDNTITIKSEIYLKGDGATNSVAERMQKNINETWNKGQAYHDSDTGKTYEVKFDVKVSVTRCPLCHAWGKDNNIIEIVEKRSRVDGSGNRGAWRGNEPDPAPHEFGHLLGLDDQYTDLYGTNFGWEGNIMGEAAMQGEVEQKNIDTILSDFVDRYNNRWIKWDKEKTYHLAPRGEFK